MKKLFYSAIGSALFDESGGGAEELGPVLLVLRLNTPLPWRMCSISVSALELALVKALRSSLSLKLRSSGPVGLVVTAEDSRKIHFCKINRKIFN